MNFPEAVTYLLNGETGEVIHGRKHLTVEERTVVRDSGKLKESGTQENEENPKKELAIPKKHENMKRVYAYLMQKRYISREVLSYFAKQGTLYESEDHHNAVFAGVDKDGTIRHIHKKGTYSDGKNFRINEEGSDPSYGFGYAGKGKKLYVFEAPIDLLSFLTLYPRNWQENSYIVLNGVSEHAMLEMLKEHPNLQEITLCLDHDAAGIEACGRLAEILAEKGFRQIRELRSEFKDWNEDLKNRNGEEALPAEEHPKITECTGWVAILKKVASHIDVKYATKESICRYYQGIYNELKKGRTKENLESAFDGEGMLLTGVLVRCMEKEGTALGHQTGTDAILDNLSKRYRPHKDKGNFNTRIRNMQKAFEEVMEVFGSKDLAQKENKELLVRKCMSLTMECIKAHIFVATDVPKQEMAQGKEMRMECSQL